MSKKSPGAQKAAHFRFEQKRKSTHRGNSDIRLIANVLQDHYTAENQSVFESICDRATSDPLSAITRENIIAYAQGAALLPRHVPPLKQAITDLGLLNDTKKAPKKEKNGVGLSEAFWERVQKQCFDDKGALSNTAFVVQLSNQTGIHQNTLSELFRQGVRTLTVKQKSDDLGMIRSPINVRLRPGQEEAIIQAFDDLAPEQP